MSEKIESFTDLITWQKAHILVITGTKIIEKSKRRYLVDQISRCLLSITSNIAEGFGRQTPKDTLHFYIMARGSLVEFQNQIIVARDLGDINDVQFKQLAEKAFEVKKLLYGLIKSTKK